MHATAITEGMKLAAAEALADLVGDDLAEDYDHPVAVRPAGRAGGRRRGRRGRSPRRRRPPVGSSRMFAVYADKFSSDDPLSGLVVGERPDPVVPDGWTTVTVKAASLNHHDLWSLRGVGLREEALPMILGCDAAGYDEDGNEVVVHAVISDPAWTRRRDASTRSGRCSPSATRAPSPTRSSCPARNVVPKPASLSFEEAACLPTAWLTAYRMLFTQGGLKAGDTVLVQGAGGGVATALITLARAGGPAGAGDQPRRGQARASAGDRRARGLRVRRPAAGQGRRGDGDRRPGDLVALDPGAAPRRRGSSSPGRRRARSSTTPS